MVEMVEMVESRLGVNECTVGGKTNNCTYKNSP